MSDGQFKKGEKGGPGRPRGLPNKATADARKAIASFVDANASRLQEWLDSIANGKPEDVEKGFKPIQPDPEKAFQLLQSVLEYHVPKLARTEHTGEGGGAMKAEVTVKFV